MHTTKHKILNMEYSRMKDVPDRTILKFNCIIPMWSSTTGRKMRCAQAMPRELQAWRDHKEAHPNSHFRHRGMRVWHRLASMQRIKISRRPKAENQLILRILINLIPSKSIKEGYRTMRSHVRLDHRTLTGQVSLAYQEWEYQSAVPVISPATKCYKNLKSMPPWSSKE